MNLVIQIEMKKIKSKDKRNQKNILSAQFLELTLIKKTFVMFLEFGKIENYISESNKKLNEESTKNSLINDLSKRS